MKAATVKQIKDELQTRSTKELIELCLRLAKFKKENKELLTYLLFEADDEQNYIRAVKADMEVQFATINTKSYYFIKKGVRKILTTNKRYIRYSQKKETEVEILLFFCEQLKNFQPSIKRSTVLKNLYQRQVDLIRKKITALHEDLQYDYGVELDRLG